MDTIEIYHTRLTTVRDGVKFLFGMETMPPKLEQKCLAFLAEIGREIERTKRALRVLSEATPLPDQPELPLDNSGGLIAPGAETTLVDKALHNKKR